MKTRAVPIKCERREMERRRGRGEEEERRRGRGEETYLESCG